MSAFSEYERKLLALAVPDLLPEIDADAATDRELAERAALVSYGTDGLAKEEKDLLPLLTILGAFGPTRAEDNLQFIHIRGERP